MRIDTNLSPLAKKRVGDYAKEHGIRHKTAYTRLIYEALRKHGYNPLDTEEMQELKDRITQVINYLEEHNDGITTKIHCIELNHSSDDMVMNGRFQLLAGVDDPEFEPVLPDLDEFQLEERESHVTEGIDPRTGESTDECVWNIRFQDLKHNYNNGDNQ